MSDLSKMSVEEMDDWIGAASTPDLETDRLSTCYNELARRHAAVTAERDRLAEIVERWKTADGVFFPDMPGYPWWADHSGTYEVGDFAPSELGDIRGTVYDYRTDNGLTLTKPLHLCYSTREAAEAARRGEEVGNG